MILAIDSNGGMGKDGTLPWHHPEDLKYFQKYTKNTICIMGRTTFLDIKSHIKRDSGTFLKERDCIVFTKYPRLLKSQYNYDNVSFINPNPSFLDILYFAKKSSQHKSLNNDFDITIIGGKSIYDMFLKENLVDEISLTIINKEYNCDTFIDTHEFNDGFEEIQENQISDICNIKIYKRKQKSE